MKAKTNTFFSFVFLSFIFIGTYWGQASKITTSAMCIVDLGADLSIDLGDSTQLFGILSCPIDEIESFSWEPTTYLSCTDCFDPVVNATDNQCYTLTVNWQDGTTTSDEACVFVEDCDEVFSENNIQSITPEQINDFADITLQITRKQYVRIEIVDDQTIQYPIWEGWLRAGLRTVSLDFSNIPSGMHDLRVRLYPENLTTAINKI